MQLTSSENCSVRTKSKAEVFAASMNPDVQMQICHDARLCIMGNFPTLAEVRKEYGSKAPEVWLIPQLDNLSEYCGVKEKLSKQQLRQLAFTIATEFFYLKVSELMLFFHRFKSGRYGRFYGSVDPLVITRALRDFIAERNNAIDIYEKEMKKKELEEYMKHAVSREEALNTEEYKRGYQETI